MAQEKSGQAAVRGETGSAGQQQRQGLSLGGLLITGSGVVVLLGTFLPWLSGLGRGGEGGNTIDMLQFMPGVEDWWPVLLIACALVIAGAGVFCLAGLEHSSGAIVATVAAAIGVAIGLAVGPFRYAVELSSEYYTIGWLPIGDPGSITLGWGTWVMVAGMVGALAGAWLVNSEYARSRALTMLSGSGMADRVPASLIGPASSGPTTGPDVLRATYHTSDDAHELVRGLMDRERTIAQERGERFTEAVWMSTTRPYVGVAWGRPDVQYRVKWPGRPIVNWPRLDPARIVAAEPELPSARRTAPSPADREVH